MKKEIVNELNELITKVYTIEAKNRALTSIYPLVAGSLEAIIDLLPDNEENRACLMRWIEMYKERLK